MIEVALFISLSKFTEIFCSRHLCKNKPIICSFISNLQKLTDHTKLMHYNANYAIHLVTNQIKNLLKLQYRAGLRSSMILTS